MSNSRLLGGIFAAGLATSGCAPYLAPYGPGYGGGFAQPLVRPLPAAAVDQSAAARGRWDNVMLLPVTSVVGVLTMDGQRVGTLSHADGYGIRVLVDGIEQQIARADVLRVDLVHLPGSDVRAVARRTAGGALLGAGAAALFAGVLGGTAWPPPGVLVRGGAALGGVSGAGAALADRQGKVIYIAESQRVPVRQPPPAYDAPGSAAYPPRLTASYSVDEWARILELRPSTPVIVITTSGVRHEGTLIGADDTDIWIDFRGAELRIARRSVRRVEVR